MTRTAVILLALLLLVQCGAEVRIQRLFLPMVLRPPIGPKGAALFTRGCEAVQLLELDWYYLGTPGCWPAEFVYYEQGPGNNGEATPYTMFYNEPEMAGWTISEMVTAFVRYANHYPNAIWVGPCVLWDLELVPQFWAEFERVAGYSMPPERIRFCFHCYQTAQGCMALIQQAAAVGKRMGLATRSLWLTEFGNPPGLDQTMRQQMRDTQALIAALEASPYIERYAYWPGIYWPLPTAAEPTVGAMPLLYQVYLPGGSGDHPVGYRLTAMGELYRDW